MTYRNRQLLDAVRTLPCQFPHDWDTDSVPCSGAVEPAHSNQLGDGKGKSIKAADYRVAACCHSSHAELDQGKLFSKAERRERWEEAHRRTIGELFERNLITVSPRGDLDLDPI